MNDETQAEELKLKDQQRIFVENYLQCWNATEAARRAGYADPELQGWRLRQNEVISEEISRRIAATAMAADEVLKRLADVARGSLKHFVVEGEGGELWPDLSTEEAKKNLHLLKKIKPKRRTFGSGEAKETETEVELEIHDPVRALELMGKHHRLFIDRQEVTGKDGGPIELTDTERAKRLEFLLNAARARRDGATPAHGSGDATK